MARGKHNLSAEYINWAWWYLFDLQIKKYTIEKNRIRLYCVFFQNDQCTQRKLNRSWRWLCSFQWMLNGRWSFCVRELGETCAQTVEGCVHRSRIEQNVQATSVAFATRSQALFSTRLSSNKYPMSESKIWSKFRNIGDDHLGTSRTWNWFHMGNNSYDPRGLTRDRCSVQDHWATEGDCPAV